MNRVFRGSRKHILDWTALEAEAFLSSLNDLLQPIVAVVEEPDIWMPQGHNHPKEAKLTAGYSRFLPESLKRQLGSWWLVHKRGANVPNWDLAATCSIDGQRGIVLVEGKAHENELHTTGKALEADASVNSRENHERIGEAVEEARQALDRVVPGVGISRDTHYQLSNRVAWTWKLASLGVPTILMYLGFVGDTGIDDVGPHFESGSHWRRVIQDHVEPVLPQDFVERPLSCGLATMQMIIRSRPILENSPGHGVAR